MNYTNMILNTIQSNKYKGLDVNGFKEAFSVSSSQELTQLMKSLNRLEDEYIIIQNEKNQYFPLEKLGYFVGVLRKNPKGFGFVENDEMSIYANRYEIVKYLDGDEVLARIIHNRDDSIECEVIKVISHSKHTVIGVIKKKNNRTWFLPDTPMPNQKFKIRNLKDFKLVNDTKVQLYIEKFGKTLECTILQIIGHKYDPGIDILSILLEHDIEPAFPKGVLQEADQIKEEITEDDKKGRLDLRDELTITIDGEDSKDLDDAISVKRKGKNYVLGVHIADVSYYVKEGSLLDKEAYKRGTSVYVVDRVVPMLPHVLSNGICSLNEKVERLTLSCIMEINHHGEVVDYKIAPSYIKTTRRMTYTNVNLILNGNQKVQKKFDDLLEMLDDAKQLSMILRKRKDALGEIDFDKKESKILVDKQGKVKDIVLRERGEAERIIEDFMIAANECVAAHTKHLDMPSIYRVHETPDPKKMREFAHLVNTMGYTLKADVNHVYPKQLQQLLKQAHKDPSFDVLSTYMLRSMRKARYDQNCLGHFGLGLQEYTHFTSPIRRYPDLIVHRMLRKHYFNHVHNLEMIEKDEHFIDEASEHTSKMERNAVEAERDVEDMKKCEYMEAYINHKFDGVVSSITKFGMFVELENTIEGLVHISTLKDDVYHYDDRAKALIAQHSAKQYKMGQKVRVKVIDASKFKKQIDFEII
ncbi:ribonuclease R [Breznakia sp. PF5-3]|uniref:ribonuclease R n=1 Tax=unclassified Breznakia TaxID=2623764 RepID=UPI00240754A0|nr:MULTISPECIES: ribonuclease R [unclassified Breznakia]MDF9823956.1 ribonuclease R [Breznakia sp. PM6-1]MDF9834755.1 ribonuclease R [Breznakia sp. PF5-3]